MAGAFPVAAHLALDVAVRAHLALALEAEAELLQRRAPAARAAALAVLRRNGQLRALRRAARAAAGLDLDAASIDGCTWDAPDLDGGFQ